MTRHDDASLVSLDELASMLRAYEGPPGPITNGAPKKARQRRRYRRAALLGGGVAVALLVGSGLGFGLGNSVTPESSAGDNLVGFGFIPARSWNVVQSGAVGAATKGHAVAANVPLHETAATGAVPYATLESLPRPGIVIAASFGLRGDPSEDFQFPAGSLPLRLEDAELVPAGSAAPVSASLTQYRLRAGVAGSNVDARIYFGSVPTQRMIAAAQRQLERLVVASDRVTIAARPAIAGPDKPVTLFGSVDNGKAGETVDIQAKDCGQQFFRAVQGATSVEGGGWSLEYWVGITTTLRAIWDGAASSQITVRKRAMIHLTPKAGGQGRFTVWLVARSSFWRKRVLIQRRDPRLGVWKAFRSVVLTEQSARGGAGVGFSADVTLSVPKGTQLRALVPASQARPCYVSGTSLPVRT